jgi:hypothetical protein
LFSKKEYGVVDKDNHTLTKPTEPTHPKIAEHNPPFLSHLSLPHSYEDRQPASGYANS